MEIQAILNRNNPKELRALFAFDSSNSNEQILFKFNIFSRYFFIQFFESEDADFHREMDMYFVRLYMGDIDSFLNIVFRGGAKTTRTKLFLAFAILNDIDHRKKYIKVLTRDYKNGAQFVTDIYNLLVGSRVNSLFPDTFQKSNMKREETMSSFTTSFGVKLTAGTVGMTQRGDIQDENRPDLIIFDDIEDRISLMSPVISNKIWINIDEAVTGLSKKGGSIYNCNYISEQGNVHKLVQKIKNQIIVPIEKDGVPMWKRYSVSDINSIRNSAEDYAGDYLCKPDASKDVYIDRECLDRMPILKPIQTIAGFKIFKKYNPSHRYAGGMDVAGGVGLDSSTSVFIDFDSFPAQVVATYASNTILPEAFGDEIYNQANYFGGCLIAPENNKYDQTILKARQLGAKLYTGIGKIIKIHAVAPTTFGWNTNSLSKSTMFSSFREAVESGLLSLNDEDLINEAKSYTRNDIIDNAPDIRLTTRHHDLLISACIAWQMKTHARVKAPLLELDAFKKDDVNPAI